MDAKRGDIGNTAQYYAEALFDKLRGDWVTLNPYMGYDSLKPFLDYKEKGAFILCLTSNNGARDFQLLEVNGKPLYKVVAEKVSSWNKDENCGLVVGATHPDQLREIREITGDMPLLIPGVGAQGGSLEEAATLGTDNFKKTAIINVSRSVLYASVEKDFAQRARQELERLNATVTTLRNGINNRSQSSQPPQPDQNEQPIVSISEPQPEPQDQNQNTQNPNQDSQPPQN
jgi:orotidine-5'-phosphate decarboxylase